MDLVNAEILAESVLEGESPKEFFRRRRQRELAAHTYREPRVRVSDFHNWEEYDDLENWQRVAVAEFQEIEGESAYLDATNQMIEVNQQGRSWIIFESEDAARAVAVSRVEDDIENEPGLFTSDFLVQYINEPRLRNLLEPDEESQLRDHYNDEWNDPQVKRDGLIGLNKLDETDFQDEDGEWLELTPELEEQIDNAFELFISDMVEDRLNDPMEYLTGIFGREEAFKFVQQHNCIDESAAAEAAVNIDGWQHFMARYDGNSYDLPSGSVYCRTN